MKIDKNAVIHTVDANKTVCTVSPEDVTRVKGLGCLWDKRTEDKFNVRVITVNGKLTGKKLAAVSEAADREAVARALDAVGMMGLSGAFADTLSGGELKKAFFAMTLAQDTPVVVLDEPTAHLDAASRFGFLSLLQKMRQETGKTFLVVMHELPEVLQCADRIVTLHERTVAFDGSPAQFLTARIPETCFGVRVAGNKEAGFSVRPAQ